MSSIRSTFRPLVQPVEVQLTAARSSMASPGSGPPSRSRSSTYRRKSSFAASQFRIGRFSAVRYARIMTR